MNASGLNFGGRCCRAARWRTTTDGRTRRSFFLSTTTVASAAET